MLLKQLSSKTSSTLRGLIFRIRSRHILEPWLHSQCPQLENHFSPQMLYSQATCFKIVMTLYNVFQLSKYKRALKLGTAILTFYT